MLPIDRWDDDYLLEIKGLRETGDIERKAAAMLEGMGADRNKKRAAAEEIAKQVCAFANAEGGLLLFGVTNAGDLDNGVEETFNGKPIGDWVDDVVAGNLLPAGLTVRSRVIARAGHQRRGARGFGHFHSIKRSTTTLG